MPTENYQTFITKSMFYQGKKDAFSVVALYEAVASIKSQDKLEEILVYLHEK